MASDSVKKKKVSLQESIDRIKDLIVLHQSNGDTKAVMADKIILKRLEKELEAVRKK